MLRVIALVWLQYSTKNEKGSTYSRSTFFVVCIKCDTSGNSILRVVESIYIDWRYLMREEKPLVYPVFLSGRPPFEGILFQREFTNIIRAPSWAFNGSTVCIPGRRVSADTLLVLQSRRASKINPPIASHRGSLASPPAFLRFVCRIASLRDRIASGQTAPWLMLVRTVCDIRRIYVCGEWSEETLSLSKRLKRI